MKNPGMKYFNSSTISRRNFYAVAIALLILVVGLFFYRERAITSKAVSSILSGYNEQSSYAQIMVDYPLNDTVFPAGIRPPAVGWVGVGAGGYVGAVGRCRVPSRVGGSPYTAGGTSLKVVSS